jgi:hypothetical protein
MNIAFNVISSFEEIIQIAAQRISEDASGYCINFILPVEFKADLLKDPQLLDATGDAALWQSVETPEELWFSHGQYIGQEGIDHIINELKKKHSGNRALFSLISQKDILGSGDRPLPSFLTFQASVEGNYLYITVYFRALETSSFLRTNLEEIRIIAGKIYHELGSLKVVRLMVYAFRAYEDRGVNLKRPRLDRIDTKHRLKLLEKNPAEISNLLREKAVCTTVIDVGSLEDILSILLNNDLSVDIKSPLKAVHITNLLKDGINAGKELANLRVRASHRQDIPNMAKEFTVRLNRLATEIDRHV